MPRIRTERWGSTRGSASASSSVAASTASRSSGQLLPLPTGLGVPTCAWWSRYVALQTAPRMLRQRFALNGRSCRPAAQSRDTQRDWRSRAESAAASPPIPRPAVAPGVERGEARLQWTREGSAGKNVASGGEDALTQELSVIVDYLLGDARP